MSSNRSYKTKQRDLILDCLAGCGESHITVDDIVKRLDENETPVGKTTVYRYFGLLADEGILRKYITEDGESACYQYVNDRDGCNCHYHLRCDECGKLFHADDDLPTHVQKKLAELYDFAFSSSRTVFHGQCAACSKVQQQREKTC